MAMQNIDGVVAAVFKRHYDATQHKDHGVDHGSGKVAPKDAVGTPDLLQIDVRLDAQSKNMKLHTQRIRELEQHVYDLKTTVERLDSEMSGFAEYRKSG